MAWAHRADGIAGVEGWIDADAARRWAREASRLFAASRAASTTTEAKRLFRAALVALNSSAAALNLPDRWGGGVIDDGFPFGIARLDLMAGDEARARTLAAATAAAGGLERLEGWALERPDGDTWYTAPDGWRWAVRVYPYPGTGERTYALLPDPSAVLAWRRALPEMAVEARAREVTADPWAAYVARRRELDDTNRRYAGYWGLTSEEQIAGFQVAADQLNQALGAEWDARQKARAQREADRILDQVSQAAALTGVGAPIAAVFQALKLLTGILPWATEAQPPPALSRTRTGGLSDAPRDRPTHSVPAPPAELLELGATMIQADAASASAARTQGLRRLPNVSPGAVLSMLGGSSTPGGSSTSAPLTPSDASSSSDFAVTTTGGASSTPAPSSASSSVVASSTSPLVIGGAVVIGGGLLWWALRTKGRKRKR